MGAPKDILHLVLDVISGKRNLTPAQANELHEALDPGYTAPTDSAESIEAARALLARQEQAAAYQASLATPAPAAASPAPSGFDAPPSAPSGADDLA